MEQISYEIENTNLSFYILDKKEVLVTGVIAWDIEEIGDHFYQVEIWWDGKIRFSVLRDGLNLFIDEKLLQIGDIEEFSAIMEGIKKIQQILLEVYFEQK